MARKLVFSIIIVVIIPACSALGPKSVTRDRFDYNVSISDSWKEQTLLNIVKIRYSDMPIFVEVASIVSGYTLERSLNIGGGLSSNDAITGDFVSLGAEGKYIDRPTITYVPITGAKFNKSFMTPIPPRAVLFLMQSGWQAEMVLPLTVEAINGHRAELAAGTGQRTGDPDYYRIVELLRIIQSSGAMGMRIQREESTDDKTVMFMQKSHLPPEIIAAEEELNKLLGLQPDLQEVEVAYGLIPKNDREITLLTRSMLAVMIELATKISVPAEHVAEGRTVPSLNQVQSVLLKVHHGTEKPEDAFTSVKYKDHWFWIDDRDVESKNTFAFVMILLSLTETSEKGGLPIVTIPAG